MQDQSIVILCNIIGPNPAQNHKKSYQRKQHHHANPNNKTKQKQILKKSHNFQQLLNDDRNKTHLNRIKTMLLQDKESIATFTARYTPQRYIKIGSEQIDSEQVTWLFQQIWNEV